jgi:hypothetical protein
LTETGIVCLGSWGLGFLERLVALSRGRATPVRVLVAQPARQGSGSHAVDESDLTTPRVIDIVDFNATTAGPQSSTTIGLLNCAKRSDGIVSGLDVRSNLLGRAYECPIRKFAESQGQRADRFTRVLKLHASWRASSMRSECCGFTGLSTSATFSTQTRGGRK